MYEVEKIKKVEQSIFLIFQSTLKISLAYFRI